jgi:hypothetical protein
MKPGRDIVITTARLLIATGGLLLATGGMALEREELYGTWRLMSYTRQLPGGEKADSFGNAPRGILNYGRDGRMFAMIVKDERPKVADSAKPTDEELAGLFKTMVAYGGTFTFDGRKVAHHVDISWNGTWTGTEQIRDIRIEGGKLYITNAQPDFVSFLIWEKVK